jgi:predicted nuclease with TOPRIM domain
LSVQGKLFFGEKYMDFGKFDLLETRLGSLLERLKALENDNQTLSSRLKTSQEELLATKKRVDELVSARDTVVTRIDALLERLAQSGLTS